MKPPSKHADSRLRSARPPVRGRQLSVLAAPGEHLGVLNQLHDHQVRVSVEFRQRGKPREGWGILPLDVNEHIGIEEVHWLFPYPSFRFVAYLPGVGLAIGDVWLRADDALALQ